MRMGYKLLFNSDNDRKCAENAILPKLICVNIIDSDITLSHGETIQTFYNNNIHYTHTFLLYARRLDLCHVAVAVL